MKITITATSTSVLDLIRTAWYDIKQIEDFRIKDRNNNNWFWVYIKNTSLVSVFLENIYTATIWNSLEIISLWDFALDVYELSKLNLMVASGTQEIKIIIT